MNIPKQIQQWAYTLVAGMIAGGAGAVVQFFSMAGAKALGADVPTLNIKAVGVLFLGGIISHAAAILMKSPLPPLVDEISISQPDPGQTKTVTLTSTQSPPEEKNK